MTPLFLGVFGISLLLSFVLTRSVRGFWVSHGWVPRSARDLDLHPVPPPRIGGVAIYLSFVSSIGVAFLASRYFLKIAPAFSNSSLLTILIPGTLIFALGFRDDIRSVSPYTKFGVQSLAGIMLFAGGLRILNLPVLFGARHFGWELSLPLTILWVIGITNAFNLIDGLDGLAAGSALFSTLVVFVVSISGQFSLVSLLTIALAGTILGFLRFNFNPATIFLGDSGSQFIGFMLSALALKGTQKSPTVVAVAIPVVSFGLPILETALSVLRRFIAGKSIFTADREHIHHKLLARGMSHRQVVILLYAVSALFALLSLFMLWPTGSTVGLVLTVLGTGIWIGVQHLGYLEFGELRRVAQRTLEQRNIFVNNLSIRRAIEELKGSSDHAHLCRALESAFCSNDFDGFDLLVNLPPEAHNIGPSPLAAMGNDMAQYKWRKPGRALMLSKWPEWTVRLELVTPGNRNCGLLEIHRFYNDRPLLVDIDLLTSSFPVVLAEALHRAVMSEVLPEIPMDTEFRAAEAG